MPEQILSALRDERLLPDRVADELREAIIQGRLQPGDRLREANIAEQLGVSTAPVREAFLRLEREGLIYNLPRRGKYVCAFSDRAVQDIQRVRQSLDTLAYAMIREQGGLSDDTQRRLQQDIDELRLAIESGDFPRSAELDFRFHDHVYAEARSEVLREMWEVLRTRLRALYYRRAAVERHRATVDAIQNHTAILSDLRRNGRQE